MSRTGTANAHRIWGLGLALVLVAMGCEALPVLAQPGDSVDFGGRIFEEQTRAGIPNVQVKLTPPRQSKLPVRLTSTDRDGNFRFAGLVRSSYLLEVSQGLHLLYRKEVKAGELREAHIALRRR